MTEFQRGALAALNIRSESQGLAALYQMILEQPGLNVTALHAAYSESATINKSRITRRLNELEDAGLIQTRKMQTQQGTHRMCYPTGESP